MIKSLQKQLLYLEGRNPEIVRDLPQIIRHAGLLWVRKLEIRI